MFWRNDEYPSSENWVILWQLKFDRSWYCLFYCLGQFLYSCIVSQAVPCNKTLLNAWGFFQFILTFLKWRKFALHELLMWGTECVWCFWSIPTCLHEISVEIIIDISYICHLTWNAYLAWMSRGCDWNLTPLCKVLYGWRPFDILCIQELAFDRDNADERWDEEAPEKVVLPSFWWVFCGSLVTLVSPRSALGDEISTHSAQWSVWALGSALREVVKTGRVGTLCFVGDFPGCCAPAPGEMLWWECWIAEGRVSHSCQAVVP